jgi:hypothetical protein
MNTTDRDVEGVMKGEPKLRNRLILVISLVVLLSLILVDTLTNKNEDVDGSPRVKASKRIEHYFDNLMKGDVGEITSQYTGAGWKGQVLADAAYASAISKCPISNFRILDDGSSDSRIRVSYEIADRTLSESFSFSGQSGSIANFPYTSVTIAGALSNMMDAGFGGVFVNGDELANKRVLLLPGCYELTGPEYVDIENSELEVMDGTPLKWNTLLDVNAEYKSRAAMKASELVRECLFERSFETTCGFSWNKWSVVDPQEFHVSDGDVSWRRLGRFYSFASSIYFDFQKATISDSYAMPIGVEVFDEPLMNIIPLGQLRYVAEIDKSGEMSIVFTWEKFEEMM